jgi:hypothetical protein
MSAHKAKRVFDRYEGARRVLAAVQLRFAAKLDHAVARWLHRCAANAESAQWVFGTDPPQRDLEIGRAAEMHSA